MSKELIINASLPEIRIALLENGEIQELLIERASGKGIVGNIYKGRVTRILPGMQAAFVDIGLKKAAFLYVDDVYVHPKLESDNLPEILPEILPDISLDLDPAFKDEKPNLEQASLFESEVVSSLTRQKEALVSELQDESIDDDQEGEDEDSEPVSMGKDPSDQNEDEWVIHESNAKAVVTPSNSNEHAEQLNLKASEGAVPSSEADPRRNKRNRRSSKFRKKRSDSVSALGEHSDEKSESPSESEDHFHEKFQEQIAVSNHTEKESDRARFSELSLDPQVESDRPAEDTVKVAVPNSVTHPTKNEFKELRARDRRIRTKMSSRYEKASVNIQDLLKEGQEILVQVAKDPISSKGARLTCHISLPGRHLVCMPTIDHIGVSRRIERDDERRKLKEYVEKYRPKNLGFIVRTASGKQQSEKRIKQDIDYLSHLWDEIQEKNQNASAPSLVYEDLNAVLRAIRDWVDEEIVKIMVDSRHYFNDIQRFVSYFMPSLKQKVELYYGDIPIFDAYGLSTQLSRSLERKVWLKSGGYIVIDQAEALVAIDVNTGRYVGKKNLEDTILKTNLEAVQEIAYQLRLRNCGGIIILDLIDMEKEENRQRVYRTLEDALQKDRARPSILKISELGLIEMTRKRTRDTMIRALCDSCTHCEGKGFVKSKQTVAYEVMREIEREGIDRDIGKVLIQAHADVIEILAIDERDTLDQLERRYRKSIYLQVVADFHPEQFEVISEKRSKVEKVKKEKVVVKVDNDQEQERKPIKPKIIPRERPIQESQPIQPVITPIQIASKEMPEIQEIDPESVGNRLPVEASQDFSDEEDRLAFLRAQVAQDAALARLGNTSPLTSRGNFGRAGQPSPIKGERRAGLQPFAPNGHNSLRRNGKKNKKNGRFRKSSPTSSSMGGVPGSGSTASARNFKREFRSGEQPFQSDWNDNPKGSHEMASENSTFEDSNFLD